MSEWKMVPVEPTEEMLSAAAMDDEIYSIRNFGLPGVQQGAYDHWSSMIAAAPPAPADPAMPSEEWLNRAMLLSSGCEQYFSAWKRGDAEYDDLLKERDELREHLCRRVQP